MGAASKINREFHYFMMDECPKKKEEKMINLFFYLTIFAIGCILLSGVLRLYLLIEDVILWIRWFSL